MTASGTHPDGLYLDDLTVGQTFTSAPHEVDRHELVAFAQRFDPQHFHVDEEAAEDSVFEGLAASGWHTGAMTMRMLVDSVPVAGGLVGLGVELQWPSATRPGDVLHLETTVADIRVSQSRPDRGIVTIQSRTVTEDGEVRQKMTGRILVPRRPGAEGPAGG